MNKNVKALALGVFAIFLFVVIAYALQYFLLPLLPKEWQSNFTWLLGTLLLTISFLSGIAQIAGIGLKDFINPKKTSQNNINDSVILVSKDQGNINWDGDVFQKGSTKIVLNTKTSQSESISSETTERLISEIQKNLHEDKKISYVLTICNDLCNLTGLSKKYGKWLSLELVNNIDIEKFRNEFKEEEQFNDWWDKWASYRLIETYLKYRFRSAETGQRKIDTLPFKKIIIGYSISEIIDKLQSARESRINEMSVPMRVLSEDYYAELLSSIQKMPIKFDVPRDVEIYFQISDLQKILAGIRQNILNLLADVRKQ